MCELNDDGSVFNDEKYIWYQGRAIWVYAFLYNNFGKTPHWLDIAARTRDFMVKHMYAGEGSWVEKVGRDGTVLEGVGETVYGWLFAAMGLAQHYIATGDLKDLELAKEIDLGGDEGLRRSGLRRYVDTRSTRPSNAPAKGVRSQGHSMVFLGGRLPSCWAFTKTPSWRSSKSNTWTSSQPILECGLWNCQRVLAA